MIKTLKEVYGDIRGTLTSLNVPDEEPTTTDNTMPEDGTTRICVNGLGEYKVEIFTRSRIPQEPYGSWEIAIYYDQSGGGPRFRKASEIKTLDRAREIKAVVDENIRKTNLMDQWTVVE